MRTILAALVASFLLVVPSVYAAAEGTPTNPDYEATIAALQTQVASGKVAEEESPTPELMSEVSPAEMDYLTAIAEVSETVEIGIRSIDYVISNPPSESEATVNEIILQSGGMPFAFARDGMPEIAPSDRLNEFDDQFRNAIQQFLDISLSLQGSPSALDLSTARRELNAAVVDYHSVLDLLNPLGLRQVFEDAVDPPPEPGNHNLYGTIWLTDENAEYLLPTCNGDGGYDDLKYGEQVTVTDGNGTLIGLGNLDIGLTHSKTECIFKFAVRNLPETDFYQLSVGGRGAPTYGLFDLITAGWEVSLSIGH